MADAQFRDCELNHESTDAVGNSIFYRFELRTFRTKR
jgi:hypothetical protein